MKYRYWLWPEGTLSQHMCETWVWRYQNKVAEATVNPARDVNHDIRISNTFFTSDDDVISTMQDFIFTANRLAFGVDVSPYVECQFTHYNGEQSGYYGKHIDSFLSQSDEMYDRKLSCVILLTDPKEFDGGELLLGTTDEEVVELKQGSIVVFPSFMAHRVAPVTRGVRHTMVGWMYGPHWR
jgi:PKHD-type hydroxylase